MHFITVFGSDPDPAKRYGSGRIRNTERKRNTPKSIPRQARSVEPCPTITDTPWFGFRSAASHVIFHLKYVVRNLDTLQHPKNALQTSQLEFSSWAVTRDFLFLYEIVGDLGNVLDLQRPIIPFPPRDAFGEVGRQEGVPRSLWIS